MDFKPVPILSAMLLLACSPNAQTTQTAQNQPAITTNAKCKNLHKVTDIDDLLHQMYTNIDSHCLFEMPTAELEKVWGVKIIEKTDKDFLSKRHYAENNLNCNTRINGLFLVFSKLNRQVDFYISKCYLIKFDGFYTDDYLFKYIKDNNLKKYEIQTLLNIPVESISVSGINLSKYQSTLEYGYRYEHQSPYSERKIIIEHTAPAFPTEIMIR